MASWLRSPGAGTGSAGLKAIWQLRPGTKPSCYDRCLRQRSMGKKPGGFADELSIWGRCAYYRRTSAVGGRGNCRQPLRQDHGRTVPDILNLIPKKLCLSEDQPGYLCCRHRLNKKSGRNKTFPTSVGVANHFKRDSYTPNSFLAEQLPHPRAEDQASQPSATGHPGSSAGTGLVPAKRPSPTTSSLLQC